MKRASLRKVADLSVSAASGLCARDDGLWAVADDERFIAHYSYAGAPLARHSVWPGELPEAHAERKRLKPDLEALTALDEKRLLALPSGSTDQRMLAACLTPAPNGAARVDVIDARPLYSALRRQLPELNIEGAAVHAGRLWLAQRGNGALAQNACIELDLQCVLASVAAAHVLDESSLRAIHALRLGDLDGVPLALTDLATHPEHGLLFCAAAEAGQSTYDDGHCTGSAIGGLEEGRRVSWLASVDVDCKLEGLACRREPDGTIGLWLVADPDDRNQRAPLWHTCLPLV
jgi:hypothetical protein